MRCQFCGWVVDGSEAKSAAEVAKGVGDCQGCTAEYDAAIAEMVPESRTKNEDGTFTVIPEHRRYTDKEAETIARQGHSKREMTAYNTLIRTRRQRVAAGKSAVDGVTDLQPITADEQRGVDADGKPILVSVTVTVAEMKRRAQEALDAEDAQR